MQISWFVTIIMQTSPDNIAKFADAATPAMDKLEMLHTNLRASVDAQLMLALPSTKCLVEALSPIIICARIDDTDYVLGIASSLSCSVCPTHVELSDKVGVS